MLKFGEKKSFGTAGKKVTKQQTVFISTKLLHFQSKFFLKTYDKFLDNGVIHITEVNFFDWRGGYSLDVWFNSIQNDLHWFCHWISKNSSTQCRDSYGRMLISICQFQAFKYGFFEQLFLFVTSTTPSWPHGMEQPFTWEFTWLSRYGLTIWNNLIGRNVCITFLLNRLSSCKKISYSFSVPSWQIHFSHTNSHTNTTKLKLLFHTNKCLKEIRII